MKAVYDVSWLTKTDIPALACSPDGAVLVTLTDDEYEALHGVPKYVLLVSDLYFVAPLEIKTKVANSSVASTIQYSNPTMQTLSLSAPEFKDLVPREHAFQILQHCYELQCNVAIYASGMEEGMCSIYKVLLDFHVEFQIINALNTVVCSRVRWGHLAERIPSFCTERQKHVLHSSLPFRSILNDKVKGDVAFYPTRLCIHGLQALYSIRGDVDGATKYRAMLNSPGATPSRETKMVMHCIKTVPMNAFLIRGERDHGFKHLDLYRHLLNLQSSFFDLAFDLSHISYSTPMYFTLPARIRFRQILSLEPVSWRMGNCGFFTRRRQNRSDIEWLG